MSINLECLRKAAARRGLELKTYDRHGDLVSLMLGGTEHFFTKHSVGALSAVEAAICRDKEYTYFILKDSIRQPLTRGFLDPSVEEKYDRYRMHGTLESIADDIEQEFSYPLIIKRNKGSQGDRVFRVRSRSGLLRRLRTIYNRRSSHYDYIALAQEYIAIELEYRAVAVAGRLELVYAKDLSGASYEGNLSPLHWNGARARKVTDPLEFKAIADFLEPALRKLPLGWAGFDVARSRDGALSLIEVNARPGFSRYIKDNGDEDIVALYARLLESLS
jgi:hypothetical protein